LRGLLPRRASCRRRTAVGSVACTTCTTCTTCTNERLRLGPPWRGALGAKGVLVGRTGTLRDAAGWCWGQGGANPHRAVPSGSSHAAAPGTASNVRAPRGDRDTQCCCCRHQSPPPPTAPPGPAPIARHPTPKPAPSRKLDLNVRLPVRPFCTSGSSPRAATSPTRAEFAAAPSPRRRGLRATRPVNRFKGDRRPSRGRSAAPRRGSSGVAAAGAEAGGDGGAQGCAPVAPGLRGQRCRRAV
jgi:hypothetical protein